MTEKNYGESVRREFRRERSVLNVYFATTGVVMCGGVLWDICRGDTEALQGLVPLGVAWLCTAHCAWSFERSAVQAIEFLLRACASHLVLFTTLRTLVQEYDDGRLTADEFAARVRIFSHQTPLPLTPSQKAAIHEDSDHA